MVTYKVVINNDAKASLRKIYQYLKTNVSLATAQKVRDGILDAIDGLATMPQANSMVPEVSNEQMIYRRVLKWSYKIIYFIDEDEIMVTVVEILHSKQDAGRLKDKLLGEK